jgi:hypothetical protein
MSFIKIEEDDGGMLAGRLGSHAGTGLMSRAMVNRGFNSFDDSARTNSMIHDSDLLDLEPVASPDIHHSYNMGPATTTNHSLMSSATPSQPFSNLSLGTTPPIPESTSPFDNFLHNQNAARSHMQHRLSQQQVPSSPRQHRYSNSASAQTASYASPRPDSHIERFIHDNAIQSASTTPMGSYDPYSASPGYSVPREPDPSVSGTTGGGSYGKSAPISTDDKQQQMLERRRRRRESHNAVERRRRDNINEKIKELSELIPEKFLMAGMDQQALQKGGDDRPNKGTILSRSVDYIRQLQSIIDEQNRAEVEFQERVNGLQRELGAEITEFKFTSAELALSRLGIGPRIDSSTPVSDDVKSPDSNQSSTRQKPMRPTMQSESKPSSETTPDFTPEFDLEFYQQEGYHARAQDESAIVFDDDYYN